MIARATHPSERRVLTSGRQLCLRPSCSPGAVPGDGAVLVDPLSPVQRGIVPDCPWLGDAGRRLADVCGALGHEDAAHLGVAPPDQAAFDLAKLVLEAAARADLCAKDITISAEEGVGFRFARGDRVAYVECYNTGAMVAVTDNRATDHVQAWDIPDNDGSVVESVGWVKDFLGE